MVRHAWLAALLCAALATFLATRPYDFDDDYAEALRARQLDQEMQANIWVRQQRYRIVNRLEQEAITLDEALEEFRPLNDADPICLRMLRTTYPGHSDEELLGYQVVVYAFMQPRDDEPARLRFLGKLLADLRQRFGSRMVELPPHLQRLTAEEGR
jgi:hypothetical protein